MISEEFKESMLSELQSLKNKRDQINVQIANIENCIIALQDVHLLHRYGDVKFTTVVLEMMRIHPKGNARFIANELEKSGYKISGKTPLRYRVSGEMYRLRRKDSPMHENQSEIKTDSEEARS